MRTPAEWAEYCQKNFKGGYAPSGRARDLYKSGQVLARLLSEWGVWRQDDVLVDVGCGNGRLAMGLIGKEVDYYGLDVIKKSIEFCREAFKGYPRFAFYHLDVYNGHYNPRGSQKSWNVVYPLADGIATVIVANSLFSHTETLVTAERNLSEMNRILKTGGRLFSTWRLVPPLANQDTDAKHTNYLREDALRMIAKAGFEIASEVGGLPKEIPIPSTYGEQTGFLAVKR